MIEVSKDAFYKAIGPEDVIVRPEGDECIWEMNHTRQRVGRTEPGYIDPMKTKRYWLTEEFATRKGIRP